MNKAVDYLLASVHKPINDIQYSLGADIGQHAYGSSDLLKIK